jgi:hypothetical protein
VSSDRDELLADLRWHWGEAYLIHCLGLGTWIGHRRLYAIRDTL